jgi:hypothetical protein
MPYPTLTLTTLFKRVTQAIQWICLIRVNNSSKQLNLLYRVIVGSFCAFKFDELGIIRGLNRGLPLALSVAYRWLNPSSVKVFSFTSITK